MTNYEKLMAAMTPESMATDMMCPYNGGDDELQNERGQPKCITGKSPSGLCSCCRADGKICCIGCKEDCNIRCGWAWIDEEVEDDAEV